MKWKILEYLREGEYTSGEELADRLGISRSAVWKHIRALRKDGYIIDSSPKKGYKLLKAPDLLFPEEILSRMKTNFLKELHHFHEIESTNDVAKRLAEEGKGEGTVVVAEVQKRGRGRMNRVWFSPPGGVWLSIILKPDLNPEQAPKMTLMAGVVVSKVIREYGLDAWIKWPNDILIGGKKVCGILSEMSAEMDVVRYVVVGIGVNVNNDIPTEIAEIATSLKKELGREISRRDFVIALLEEFENEYRIFKERDFSEISKKWKEFSHTIGREVQIFTRGEKIEGKALDIDENGALILKTRDGVRKVISGDLMG
ncbi:MAG: biotin--[acetyl-CoA-carboxylase] ligase [Candidatus Syntropharchaeia archaeon]